MHATAENNEEAEFTMWPTKQPTKRPARKMKSSFLPAQKKKPCRVWRNVARTRNIWRYLFVSLGYIFHFPHERHIVCMWLLLIQIHFGIFSTRNIKMRGQYATYVAQKERLWWRIKNPYDEKYFLVYELFMRFTVDFLDMVLLFTLCIWWLAAGGSSPMPDRLDRRKGVAAKSFE